jgi:hypothetical protein
VSIGVAVGPALSLNNNNTPVGLRVSGRVGYAFNLAPQLGVLVGFMTGFQLANAGSTSLYGFDLLPHARLGFLAVPALRIYAEFGVGPVIGSSSTTVLGTTFTTNNSGLGIRIASGVEYAVSPQIAVALEPVGILVANSTTTVLGTPVSTSATSWGLTAGVVFSL